MQIFILSVNVSSDIDKVCYFANTRIMLCFIIPPHMLRNIFRNGNNKQKVWAQNTITLSTQLRKARQAFPSIISLSSEERVGVRLGKQRIIYTANHMTTLPGTEIGTEGNPPTDVSGKQAFDGTGAIYDLYLSAYQRNSIDGKGLSLISSVHYSESYDNAFWDGGQMVYGDGDGQLFTDFTKPIDVTGHELTHGVTQYTANLTYEGQSGALNESFSDVFGSLVKQKSLNQTADKADWLIGQGIFTPQVHGVALRSMAAPGTAYDDPVLGKDPQPGDMVHYVKTPDDNGGVHTNSGIPNHAFYLAAVGIGGFAWEGAGKIWYKTLTEKLSANAQFTDCALATIQSAQELFGVNSPEQQAVHNAWKEVGII